MWYRGGGSPLRLHALCSNARRCAVTRGAGCSIGPNIATPSSTNPPLSPPPHTHTTTPQESIEYGLIDAIIAKPQLIQSRDMSAISA